MSNDASNDFENLGPVTRDRSLWGIVTTQFLGAFNDNVYKQFVLLICVGGLQSVAQAVFAIPFVFGSWLAGAISDRTSKRSLVVLCKVLEIGVMASAVIVLLTTPTGSDVRRFWLIVVLGFMALQSTLFGPSKYGILPELFRSRDLPAANGIMTMTTFLAIIFGSAIAGILVEHLPPQYAWVAGMVCVGIAVLGTFTALMLRPTKVAEPDLVMSGKSLWMDADVWSVLKSDGQLFRVLVLTSGFWFLGSMIQTAINDFGVQQMGWGKDDSSYLQAILGLGIALGCGLAAKLSGDRADFPLARRASIGMSVFAFGLACLGEFNAMIPATYLVSAVLFFGLGIATGLFAVPLQTFLQTRPPDAIKGRMIGTMNFFNFGGILLGAVVYGICGQIFGTGPGEPISRSFAVVAAFLIPIALGLRMPAEKLR